MKAMEFEMGMLVFRTVLRSFKDHCEERDCGECVFTDQYGVCILAVTPNKYDIEKIQEAIRKNVREEGQDRWI